MATRARRIKKILFVRGGHGYAYYTLRARILAYGSRASIVFRVGINRACDYSLTHYAHAYGEPVKILRPAGDRVNSLARSARGIKRRRDERVKPRRARARSRSPTLLGPVANRRFT